jgi:hypothetical protein
MHGALVAAAALAAAPHAVVAQTCTSHASCLTNFYCDAGMSCYTCTFISPTTCDAFDGDCCGPTFLVQCPTNPAQCPPPPPAPGPGEPGEDEEEGGGRGWTITILLLVSASLYVGGGLGYVRYVSKEEDGGKPLLQNHPHYSAWQEVPGLVSDGYIYFRAMIGQPVAGEVISSANKQTLESFDEIPPAQKAGGVAPKGISATKKKKPKPKPKPKAAGGGSGDTVPLLDVDVDTGSPQVAVE